MNNCRSGRRARRNSNHLSVWVASIIVSLVLAVAPLGTRPAAANATGPLETPVGQVLVLNANVIQGTKAETAPLSCPALFSGATNYNDNKACDRAGRRQRFANRVYTLSTKLVADGIVEDGMGFAPDIITLQEIYQSEAADIKDRLNTLTANLFDYRVAIGDSTAPDGANSHNAIIYSHATMRKIDAGGFILTSGGGTSQKGNPYSGFRELVNGSPTGLAIAVATVHFPRANVFNPSDNDPNTPDEPSDWKGKWAEKIATKMEDDYKDAFNGLPADRYAITGDFNAGKCDGSLEPSGDEPADKPASSSAAAQIHENPACIPRSFWTQLASLGYVDTVFAANSASINFQYQDGKGKDRAFRIDHIFAKGDNSYLDASFDLTCGEVDSVPTIQQTCTYLLNPQRYSDHRIVWAMLGLDGSPL